MSSSQVNANIVGASNLAVPSTETGMNVNESYAALKNPSPLALNNTTATQFPSGASGKVRVTNPAGNDLVAIGGLPGSGDEPYFLPGHTGVARGTMVMPGDYEDFSVTDSGLLSGISLRNGDIITVQSLLSSTDYQTPTNDPPANPLSVEPFAVRDSTVPDGSTQVPLDTVITLTLTRPPDHTTVTTANVEVTPAVTGLTVYVNPGNSSQIVINPNGLNFAMATTYTITIPNTLPDVVDQQGNPFNNPYTASFTSFTPATPAVTSVTPGNNATGVSISIMGVTVVLNVNVKPTDVTTGNVQLINQSTATAITSTLTLSPDNTTITIKPSANLSYNTAYYVKLQNLHNIANIVQSPNPFDGSVGNVGLFTTFSPATPTVTSVTPGSGGVGVSTTTVIQVVMNVAVKSADITSTNVQLIKDSDSSTVTQAGGSPALSADGLTITITPSAALLFSNAYYVQLSNVHNLAGTIISPSPWSGKTQGPNAGYFTTTSTGAPPTPTVSSVSPGNNSTAIATSTAVAITFNTAITPALATTANIQLFNEATSALVATGSPVLTGSNTIATITPSASLSPSTSYYIIVQNQQNTNTVTQSPNPFYGDSRGGNLGRFTTTAGPPNVSTVTPGNNATGVAITTSIVVVMTQTVKGADITTTNVQLIQNSNSAVISQGTGSPSLGVDNKTITITPAASLANNTAYYAKLQNIHNTPDNVLESPSPWSGATVGPNAGLFTTAPLTVTVSSVTPGSNATGVAVNTAVTIVMSVQVKSANVTTSNVTLIRQSDGATITSTVSLNATDKVTITLTPSANLDNGAIYYVVVQSQVSVSGSVAQSPSPWYGDTRQSNAGLFTTVAVAPPTPNVVSVTPGNNTGGVAISTTVAVLMNTPVQSADITTTNVKLIQASNSNVVASTVSLGADQKTITIDPTANLANSTTYYATVANVHNTSAVVQSPNPYNPYVAPGTTTAYNIGQSPSGTVGTEEYGPYMTATDAIAYGEKATSTNGLTNGPITKVILPQVAGSSNRFNTGLTQTAPTGTIGVQIVDSSNNVKYTFAGASGSFTASSTGYTNLYASTAVPSFTFKGWTNVTLQDTSNTYTMAVGDVVLITWNGTGTNAIVVSTTISAGYNSGMQVTSGNVLQADSVTTRDLAATISVTSGGGGANTFTTGSSTYTQRYLQSQSTTPCGSSGTAGWDPFSGATICSSSGGAGIGIGPTTSNTNVVGIAYGQKATSTNGLTTKPITKVVIPAIIGTSDNFFSGGTGGQGTPPTGVIGIKIVNSTGTTTKYTFGQTFTASSTGYANICDVTSCGSYHPYLHGWTSAQLTFIDTNNNYTMVAGDCILVTWTGTGDNVLLISSYNAGTGNAVYQASDNTIHAISGHDFAATLYSSS